MLINKTKVGPQMWLDVKSNLLEILKQEILVTKQMPKSYIDLQRYLVKVIDDMYIEKKTFNKKTEEVEIDTLPINNYFQGSNEKILKEVYVELSSWYLQEPEFLKFHIEKNVKPSEVLKILKDMTPFVKAQDVPVVAKWVFRLIHHVQTMAETGIVDIKDAEKTSLLWDCTVKGSGKSFWIKNLIQALKDIGGNAIADVSLPQGGFYNTLEESRNILVGYEERRDQKVHETTLQHIYRHELYDYTVKGMMTQQVQAKAWTIGSTNGFAYSKGDRGIQKVNCISRKFLDLPENIQKSAVAVTPYIIRIYKLNFNFSGFLDFWANLVEGKLNTLKKMSASSNPENLKIQMHDYARLWYENFDDLRKSFSVTETSTFEELISKLSVSGFNRALKQRLNRELTYSQQNAISQYFQYLQGQCGFDKVGYEKEDKYVRYNLLPLKDYEWQEVTDVQVSALQEVIDTQETWDELIKIFEDYEKDPKNKFLKGSEAKLDESWNILNKYDKEGEYNRDGDQVCVNKPLREGKQTRKNDEVHKQNYLFECDDIPLKQQVEQIENAPQELKDALLWTCYTGGKSIHAVVITNTPDDVTSEERKYIHQKLNEKYFGGNADPSGQNAGRLARAPNAIRQDEKHPGKKQLCLQFNMNAKPIDITDILNDCREEARLKATLKELTQVTPSIPKEISINTLEQLKQWNKERPSKAKQECIEFLEGTLDDWNRSLACVRELRNFGFTDLDIENEGPVNDRWIRSAIKSAK